MLINDIVEATGISEADIKSISAFHDRDFYLVKRWNWQKIIVSGQEIHNKVYRRAN